MTAIGVRDLVCEADGARILDGVSFSVESGEFVSIIGPNGAGKTTLLKTLIRIHRAASGRIEVLGRDIDTYSQRELAANISYVPQGTAVDFSHRVFDFVLMGRYPYLSPFSSVSAEDRAKAREALERTGALRFEDRSMGTLSGGERQKVLIAAALAQEARILLLDEPATFLDYRHQVEVLELIHHLHTDSGLTVLTVTHDVNAALRLGGRAIALKAGSVAFDGEVETLLAGGALERIFDTPFAVTSTSDGQTLVAARRA